jgi:predicted TPR repeat methyltransferase
VVLGDIAETLRTRRDKFDLMLAADVFIYVGALEEMFEECKRVCAANGLFVFSVEAFDGEGYCLRPSGRFAHSQRYVISLAVQHGFELLSEDAVTIRQQQEGAIPGWLYVIRKAR